MKKTKQVDVTVVIPTKDRYFSTLPLTLSSIATQTVKPKCVMIYDDGERFDLRNNQTYSYIFNTFDAYGIQWKVMFGEGRGQAVLHDRSISDAETEFIWRIDDDCVAEPNALKILYYFINSRHKIGAVGGIVAEPGHLMPRPKMLNGTLDDVYFGKNVQWYASEAMQVTHLYSSFIYKKSAAEHGYNTGLSPASHREETIFSHQMYRNGYELYFIPEAVTWHYRNKDGGIRTAASEMFAHDEDVFNKIHDHEWGYADKQRPLVVMLDNGIGDHYAFKHILGELIERFSKRRIIIACCYPDVFHDEAVEIVSIHEAKAILGDVWVQQWNVYRKLAHCPEGTTLIEAFRKLYLP